MGIAVSEGGCHHRRRHTNGANGRRSRRGRRRPSRDLPAQRPRRARTSRGGVLADRAGGEILGLVGESGSGKSVLGFSLLGLLPAHTQVDGTVTVAGSDMVHGDDKAIRKVRRLDLGAVFQDPMTSLNPPPCGSASRSPSGGQ